ncbi:hypothetical protein LIER_11930 [Lithospermum erythrorhizon]|uniref:Uncharacterized protein n=1 Tax=Lithospermum erythrorhizon TaxID=34254 RepID=A0AAV3PPT1_LITER
MYPSTRWTCLGSLYSKAVSCAESKFVECRTIGKPTTGLQIPWEHMDVALYNTVLGINNNWASKAWEACDYVFGIENVANCH